MKAAFRLSLRGLLKALVSLALAANVGLMAAGLLAYMRSSTALAGEKDGTWMELLAAGGPSAPLSHPSSSHNAGAPADLKSDAGSPDNTVREVVENGPETTVMASTSPMAARGGAAALLKAGEAPEERVVEIAQAGTVNKTDARPADGKEETDGGVSPGEEKALSPSAPAVKGSEAALAPVGEERGKKPGGVGSRLEDQGEARLFEEVQRLAADLEKERIELKARRDEMEKRAAELDARAAAVAKEREMLKTKAAPPGSGATDPFKRLIAAFEKMEPETSAAALRPLYIKDREAALRVLLEISTRQAGAVMDALASVSPDVAASIAHDIHQRSTAAAAAAPADSSG
ncbi:MAG: hypothetical protein ACE5ID_10665 [Acidobacteriota bacterium]